MKTVVSIFDTSACRPVDLSAKDKEITERVEKDRESVAARVQHTMSRTSSKGGLERTASKPGSPRAGPAANVRPTVSFASALGNQETSEGADSSKAENEAAHITEKLSHAAI
jgi:translation initiation factor 4B